MAALSDETKLCAVLSYVFPVGLIWYLADSKIRKEKYVAWHVHQSLAAAIVVFGLWIVGAILSIIFIGLFVLVVAGIAALVWFVQGLINALSGKQEELWVVGPLGKRFDF